MVGREKKQYYEKENWKIGKLENWLRILFFFKNKTK
jgi:hypothetical protein